MSDPNEVQKVTYARRIARGDRVIRCWATPGLQAVLDTKLREVKKRGLYKTNKSDILRVALESVSIETLLDKLSGIEPGGG